ncbi:uncharacterized protein EMH_0082180 [Eimeria mitis]|uniref:Uncharacterized protein n=1 Tax=Eimeria mitis TaxID=44415 RepID=U6K5W4_9EIME|nr:uncharacterized protein EMH_0028720 [Eimeria mitis]XP_013355939.1 uncharacterized protein EMH_0082180 [Eimeria mitis]CDJ27063.1 hypothetical protein EMH_0028720 [Eimeria mitis]CDJ33375.1 hypothetical protein, conserved [Eimeria mitis]
MVSPFVSFVSYCLLLLLLVLSPFLQAAEGGADPADDPFALLLSPSPQQQQQQQQQQQLQQLQQHVKSAPSAASGDSMDLQGLFEAPTGDAGVGSLRLDSAGNLVVADGPKEAFCCRHV